MSDVLTRDFTFDVGANRLAATAYTTVSCLHLECLVLHGAGNSSKDRTAVLCRSLAANGFPSLTFDFSGHGHSSGSLQCASLSLRTSEAQGALRYLRTTKRCAILAFSMSGHIAIDLLRRHPERFDRLVLLAPAIYDDAAYDVPFGPEFSQIIRTENSWLRSSAPSWLSTYTGSVLIVSGNADTVIPKQVIDLLFNASSNAARRRLIRLENIPHQLGQWMTDRPSDAEPVLSEIIAFLARG